MGNKKKRVVINEGEGLTLRVNLGHWVQQELTYENVKDMLFFINKQEQNKDQNDPFSDIGFMTHQMF